MNRFDRKAIFFMSNKAIKYRIYPTTKQCELLQKTFGCCRKVYNLMLADKNAYYKETGKTLSCTPAQYKDKYSFLKEVDSSALANVQMHLQTAFTNFFSKRAEEPKFKSKKKAKKSYTTSRIKNNICIVENGIKLPKVGIIKAVIHRKASDEWILKSATLSQYSDGSYYVSVLYEYDEVATKVPVSTNAIGLDYKSDGLYTDSNGNTANMPKFYRQSQKKLAKEQRKLSRKKGSCKNETKSKNYLKQQKKVAKLHRHITNQRLDYLHKLTTEIANQYDVVCVEDLNMKAMSNKGFGNGKATLDNGYGLFLQLLEYKLLERGKYLVKVDKWYPSSQICSNCGRKHKLTLKDRVYVCECGLVIDRDYNAAINILIEGLKVLMQAA